MTIEVNKCPLCNKENLCGNERKEPMCWCSHESFPEGIFELVPKAKRNRACICKDCLEKYKNNYS